MTILRSLTPKRQSSSYAQAIGYCQQRVRNQDHEGFLTSLFFPSKATRELQWTLRALNLELAQVRDSVNQDGLGLMRLEWWRDAVQKTFLHEPPEHPVTIALDHHLQRSKVKLSSSWLLKLISCRKENLTMKQYPTLDALEAYTEAAFSSLMYTQLESLGVQDVKLDHLASHLGKAMGLTSFIRGTPIQALQHGRCYLPSDLCAKHSLSTEDILRVCRNRISPVTAKQEKTVWSERLDQSNKALTDVVYGVSSVAHQHVQVAREHIQEIHQSGGKLPVLKQGWPVMLQALPSIRYLNRLEQGHFDVLHPQLVQPRDWRMPFDLWWHSRKHRL